MFSFKQKENNLICLSEGKRRSLSFSQEVSRSQKTKKMTLMRQMYIKHSLEWKVPIQTFTITLNDNNNYYSLLVTLFEITEDPLWRNRIGHICLLIKKLHNICAQNYGHYLAELAKIENYHHKLIHIFYLNNNTVQEHFKLLIRIYLSYNDKFQFLNEAQIAIGLLDASKTQGVNKTEYLWIVSQLKISSKVIGKVLKVGSTILQANCQSIGQAILPIITIISNYIYYELNTDQLQLLTNQMYFQEILMFGLKHQMNYDLQRESLLLCNNLLSKSLSLAAKILSSSPLIVLAGNVIGEEQQAFQRLVSIRKGELGMI